MTKSAGKAQKQKKNDYSAGVEIGIQANGPKDLFFISDLKPRVLQGTQCPGLTAPEWGEHSARQEKDIHTALPEL